MKKFISMLCIGLLCFSLAACQNPASSAVSESGPVSSAPEPDSSVSEKSDSTPEGIESPASDDAAPVSSDQEPSIPKENSDETPQIGQRQIRVQAGETILYYELNDSPAATGLYNQLPLTLQVEDYSTNEKIFYPAAKLDTADTPLAEGGAGTLAYYAPWGNVVMFYGDFNANDSLYGLGQILSGGDWISGLSGTITVDKAEASEAESTQDAQGTQVKLTAGDQEMIAVLEDNITTRALLEQLTMTVSMKNLFGREMAYYFEEALPTDSLVSGEYAAGDLVYWPPKNSLAIFYANDGSSFERQNLGHIVSGYEIFEDAGDMEVTIELAG